MTTMAAAIRRWASPRIPVLQAVALFTFGSAILTADFPLLFVFDADRVLPATDPLRLVSLVVICSVELLRSRAPVLALGVGLGVIGVESFVGVSLATIIVFSDLLFAATLYGSRRTNRVIIWVAGAVGVALVVSVIVLAQNWQAVVVTVLQLCGIPLIPVWWAMNVRQQREVARAERARADQLARIAELDREAAVAAERSRMARDLHDVIAGHLSAIAIQSEAVLSMVDGDPATMRKVLRAVRENSVASLEEMRAMIGLLRTTDESDVEHTAPARLRDIGQLLDSARAAGVEVAASADEVPDLPVAVDLSAYRIVQEALTNVVKHAPGSRAEVTVGRRNGTLVVEVTNERDASSTVDSGTGHGLLNMRERAQAVGGVLVAGPHERLWRVRAELPAEGERD